MRDPIRLTPADARRVPWRTGRGVTEELAVWPEGASFERGDFDGRISKAGVTEPGPFSSFPGYDRVLVVTSGAGLVLSHGDVAPPARVAPLQPYAFSGDWPTTAELVNGPVTDFNVIVRRGRGRADVRVARRPRSGALWLMAGGEACDLFVHVLAGEVLAAVRTRGVEWHDLGGSRVGDSVWLRDVAPEGEAVELSKARRGDSSAVGVVDPEPAVVIVVRITLVASA